MKLKFIVSVLILIFFVPNMIGQQSINHGALTDLLKKSKDSHTDGLAIIYNEEMIIESYSDESDKLIPVYSIKKSLINLCIGKLVTDGKIKTIDTPVMNYFPEWNRPLKEKITIRHLLSHTSGLEETSNESAYWNSPDVLEYSLSSNAKEIPGRIYQYSTKNMFILQGLIEKVSGESFESYMVKEIFKPLGIENFRWTYDAVKNPKVLSIAAGDLIKVGQLIMNRGMWIENRLISENWITESLKSAQSQEPESGMLWWIIPEDKKYVVNNLVLEALEKSGVNNELVTKISSVKGVYADYRSLSMELSKVFGADWKELFKEKIYPFTNQIYMKELSENILGYKAIGWKGQYLIIYPQKGLVAVRMIENKDSYNYDTDEWYDFEEDVFELIKR
ncbi:MULTISPECIES: serine hydrolase domain-containing protein [unclassified Allomuricauda]|uniref:serine hydrolase domain-containing protein n=1 Tax=unclassified Allomuricauda TaxID=2615049 RepID=UPI00273DA2E6|nr:MULTISPECIES: serine hydrolase [unclassified Allomuricauda]